MAGSFREGGRAQRELAWACYSGYRGPWIPTAAACKEADANPRGHHWEIVSFACVPRLYLTSDAAIKTSLFSINPYLSSFNIIVTSLLWEIVYVIRYNGYFVDLFVRASNIPAITMYQKVFSNLTSKTSKFKFALRTRSYAGTDSKLDSFKRSDSFMYRFILFYFVIPGYWIGLLAVVLNSLDIQCTDGFLDIIRVKKTDLVCASNTRSHQRCTLVFLFVLNLHSREYYHLIR